MMAVPWCSIIEALAPATLGSIPVISMWELCLRNSVLKHFWLHTLICTMFRLQNIVPYGKALQTRCTVYVMSAKWQSPERSHSICLKINLRQSRSIIGQCLLYSLSLTVVSLVLYAVDKGLRGQNVLHQLLLILLRICSWSVCPRNI